MIGQNFWKKLADALGKKDGPPTALHAMNQPLVNAMWEELQGRSEPKYSLLGRAPVPFVDIDNALVSDLWKQLCSKAQQSAASQGKISMKDAEASGLLKKARSIGWGIYQIEEIDGGLGSIWFTEKDAQGNSFLVKQVDPAGDIVRKIKTASADSAVCPRCHGSGSDPESKHYQQPCSACKGEGKIRAAAVKKTAAMDCPKCGNPMEDMGGVYTCKVCAEEGKVGDGTPDEDPKIAVLRRIVNEGQNAKVDGVRIDLFSASAVMKVYEALSEENRQKYVALPIVKMVDVAFKLLKKQGSAEALIKTAAGPSEFGGGPSGKAEYEEEEFGPGDEIANLIREIARDTTIAKLIPDMADVEREVTNWVESSYGAKPDIKWIRELIKKHWPEGVESAYPKKTASELCPVCSKGLPGGSKDGVCQACGKKISTASVSPKLDRILGDIQSLAGYFSRCREIGQGIGSKESVQMRHFVTEALRLGATPEQIKSEFTFSDNSEEAENDADSFISQASTMSDPGAIGEAFKTFMKQREKGATSARTVTIVVADAVEGMPDSRRSHMDTFLTAYIEAALWSSTDNSDESGGDPLDKNYSTDDIADDSFFKMSEDCEKFKEQAGELLSGIDDEMAGHDFWLTRNGHGAGFWDRGYSENVGKGLTDIAHAFGEQNIYVGDDGKLHV